jgi:hypothetical protein
MAKASSANFAVLTVDGYNLLSAKVQGFAHEIEVELEQTDGLGDSWREHTPTGMRKATLEQTGAFFDTTAAGIHDAMKDMPATERLVAWAVLGNTIGSIFSAVKGAFTSSYAVLSSVGKLTKANVKYAVTGQLDEGVILQAHQQQTIDWTNAGVDNGASSANGGVGYLQVSQLAGLTGFVGKIRHSTDNVSYFDLVTFVNVTAAPAAQRIVVAGAVNRWLRFEGDVTGAGTITPFAGFTRNA